MIYSTKNHNTYKSRSQTAYDWLYILHTHIQTIKYIERIRRLLCVGCFSSFSLSPRNVFVSRIWTKIFAHRIKRWSYAWFVCLRVNHTIYAFSICDSFPSPCLASCLSVPCLCLCVWVSLLMRVCMYDDGDVCVCARIAKCVCNDLVSLSKATEKSSCVCDAAADGKNGSSISTKRI